MTRQVNKMRISGKIVTVGLCPSWDTICRVEGIRWGEHKVISSSDIRPAGKALNISRALAWMGERNIAAGLWGREDFQQMLKAMEALRRQVKVRMTVVDGSTRQNINVVDTVNNRDIHLRSVSRLASRKTLAKLRADLAAIVTRNSVCVFAGAMPGSEFLGDVVRIINSCRKMGAKIALDTSGDALREVVGSGALWLIKPNVRELGGLLAEKVKDGPVSLAKAGRKLLGKVEIVLISRGKKGAVVVTDGGTWQGRCTSCGKVLSTVGCGDFLLAGFLKGLKDKSDAGSALGTAIKVATAKAWGRMEGKSRHLVLRDIKVVVERV